MHVCWGRDAAATPHGKRVFFAEFLAVTGVFERWVSACPLEYRSGNAPDKRDVLGNLRLVLAVQLSSGKQHTSVHAKAALGRLLDELGTSAQPWSGATRATATKACC